MNFQNILYRKAFHLLLLLIPMAYYFLGKWQTLIVIAPVTAILVTVDYLRKDNIKIRENFNKIFGAILKPEEMDGSRLCGASFVGLAACINFFFFKEEIAITSFIILAISDASASVVGKSVQSQPFFEKSMAGSATFLFTALVILICCGIGFEMKFWYYFFGLFAVFCVTMIEARPSLLKLDDNFSIPITFGVIMSFFDILWNYNY